MRRCTQAISRRLFVAAATALVVLFGWGFCLRGEDSAAVSPQGGADQSVRSGASATGRSKKSSVSVLLRYRFSAGTTFRYQVTQSNTLTLQRADIQQVTRNETRTETVYRVVAVDERGNATLEPVIEAVHMEASADGEHPIVFDSRQPADECPVPFRPILKVLGRPLVRVTVSPLGRIERAEAVGVQQVSAEQATEVARRHGQRFFVEFPERAVAVGDSWTQDFEVRVAETNSKLTRTIKMRRRYWLKSVEGDVAEITFKTAPLTPIFDPTTEAQVAQVRLEGTLRFDVRRGVLLSRQASYDGLVVAAFGPQTAMRAVIQKSERLLEPRDGGGSKAGVASGRRGR